MVTRKIRNTNFSIGNAALYNDGEDCIEKLLCEMFVTNLTEVSSGTKGISRKSSVLHLLRQALDLKESDAIDNMAVGNDSKSANTKVSQDEPYSIFEWHELIQILLG